LTIIPGGACRDQVQLVSSGTILTIVVWAAAEATAGALVAAKTGTATVPKQTAAMAVAMKGLAARAVMWLIIFLATFRRIWLAVFFTRLPPT
jgi:hypothetical protein